MDKVKGVEIDPVREKLTKLLEPWLAHLSLAAANDLIANGVVISNSETTTKWIPVTERLPEESGLFLVYTARGMAMEMDYSAKYKQFNMYDDGIGTPIACTHWMYMPEPPKGE